MLLVTFVVLAMNLALVQFKTSNKSSRLLRTWLSHRPLCALGWGLLGWVLTCIRVLPGEITTIVMHWELLWHLKGAPETDDSNLEFSISFWNKLSSCWQRSQELSLHPTPTSHLHAHTPNLTLLFSRGKWYDDNVLYSNSLLGNQRLQNNND